MYLPRAFAQVGQCRLLKRHIEIEERFTGEIIPPYCEPLPSVPMSGSTLSSDTADVVAAAAQSKNVANTEFIAGIIPKSRLSFQSK